MDRTFYYALSHLRFHRFHCRTEYGGHGRLARENPLPVARCKQQCEQQQQRKRPITRPSFATAATTAQPSIDIGGESKRRQRNFDCHCCRQQKQSYKEIQPTVEPLPGRKQSQVERTARQRLIALLFLFQIDKKGSTIWDYYFCFSVLLSDQLKKQEEESNREQEKSEH